MKKIVKHLSGQPVCVKIGKFVQIRHHMTDHPTGKPSCIEHFYATLPDRLFLSGQLDPRMRQEIRARDLREKPPDIVHMIAIRAKQCRLFCRIPENAGKMKRMVHHNINIRYRKSIPDVSDSIHFITQSHISDSDRRRDRLLQKAKQFLALFFLLFVATLPADP